MHTRYDAREDRARWGAGEAVAGGLVAEGQRQDRPARLQERLPEVGSVVSYVRDKKTANALRRAALVAGMLARIDVREMGVMVTIDHADGRRASALNLVDIYTRAEPASPHRGVLELILSDLATWDVTAWAGGLDLNALYDAEK